MAFGLTGILNPVSFLSGGKTVNRDYAGMDAGSSQILDQQNARAAVNPEELGNEQFQQASRISSPLTDAGLDNTSLSLGGTPQSSINAAIQERSKNLYNTDMARLKNALKVNAYKETSDLQNKAFEHSAIKDARDQGRFQRQQEYDQQRRQIKQGVITGILGTAGTAIGMYAGGAAGAQVGSQLGKSAGPKPAGTSGGMSNVG